MRDAHRFRRRAREAADRRDHVRIALINWSRRRAGGAESYLAQLIPALSSAGHRVSLWFESDLPGDREPIAPDAAQGPLDPPGLAALRAEAPDVLYAHGLQDPGVERAMLEIAPAVFFGHGYYGTCISGGKTWKSVPTTCSRHFGPPCLLHYYPHRCGGLNPFVMAREYARQGGRLENLARYAAILTHSRHMRNEFARHVPGTVEAIPFPVASSTEPRAVPRAGAWRITFVGRMEFLKGGHLLLDALPAVAERLGPLAVTMVGDGPSRAEWEAQARRVTDRTRSVKISFTGWLARGDVDRILDATDLLVMPSIWPEPLGMAGLEAGVRGVPVAAFAVGGIPDWLEDDINGFLARTDRPDAPSLAAAIVRCLEDPARHAQLRRGAREVASRFTMERHLPPLLAALALAQSRRST